MCVCVQRGRCAVACDEGGGGGGGGERGVKQTKPNQSGVKAKPGIDSGRDY